MARDAPLKSLTTTSANLNNNNTATETISTITTPHLTLKNNGNNTNYSEDVNGIPCLDKVLSYLNKSDLVKTALVSKLWKEVSIKTLWSHFTFVKEREFERIFHILSKRQCDYYGSLIKSIELIHSDRDFILNANHIFLITRLCPNLESIHITFHHTRAVAPPNPSHLLHRQQPQPQQRNLPLPMLQRQHAQQQQQPPPPPPPPTPQQPQQQKGPQYTHALPLAHFSYNCPKLKSIKLDSYSPKTDDSVYEMAKYMNSGNLESITFANCMTLQSSTLCKLAITNPQLKRIELSGNTPVSDSSFATLMDRCGDYLEYLSISNAYSLTDKSIRYIASRCKKIKQICLFNNTERISEDTLTAIITHCPTLEMLSLSDSRCLGSLFFHSVVQRVNIEIANITQHQLNVDSGLQKICLGGVQRDMIHSKYMKELIDKSAPHLDINSPIIRGNTFWWQRQHLMT
jgi:hypothetical protein